MDYLIQYPDFSRLRLALYQLRHFHCTAVYDEEGITLDIQSRIRTSEAGDHILTRNKERYI